MAKLKFARVYFADVINLAICQSSPPPYSIWTIDKIFDTELSTGQLDSSWSDLTLAGVTWL